LKDLSKNQNAPVKKIACRKELSEADPKRSAAIPFRSIACPLNRTETPEIKHLSLSVTD
jgi:hypothetical protein